MKYLYVSALTVFVLLLLVDLSVTRAAEDSVQPLPKVEPFLLRTHMEQLSFELQIDGGRLALRLNRRMRFKSRRDHPNAKEELSVTTTLTGGTINYRLETDEYLYVADFSTEGTFDMELSPCGGSSFPRVLLKQYRSDPIELRVARDQQEEVFKFDSVWLFWFQNRAVAQAYLGPLLDCWLREGSFVEKAQQLQENLLTLAKLSPAPNVAFWDQLISQLSDPKYSVRERADRLLRRQGLVVIPYLLHLDWDSLDAEQQIRISNIIRYLRSVQRQSGGEYQAWELAGNPKVWITLMDHDDATVRRVAADWLGRMFGLRINFDPEADQETRRKQLAAIKPLFADW